MPSYCQVNCSLACPSCHAEVDHQIDFQWGCVPWVYNLGDPIYWIKDQNNQIVKSWKYVQRQEKSYYNCGDPAYKDVLLIDPNVWRQDLNLTCQHCSGVMDAGAVFVRSGMLQEVRLFSKDELFKLLGYQGPWSNIHIITPAGLYEPQPEWEDPELDISGLY